MPTIGVNTSANGDGTGGRGTVSIVIYEEIEDGQIPFFNSGTALSAPAYERPGGAAGNKISAVNLRVYVDGDPDDPESAGIANAIKYNIGMLGATGDTPPATIIDDPDGDGHPKGYRLFGIGSRNYRIVLRPRILD